MIFLTPRSPNRAAEPTTILSRPSMFVSRFIRTDYHTGQISIPHRPHAVQQEVCSSIWGQQLRRRGRQAESSSVLPEDRIYPSIEVVARSGRMRLLTIVAQIPRRCPMKRLVDQQADLELDSKGNWKPV